MNAASKQSPIASLPRIIRYDGMDDYGPSDGGQGSTTCPHCGSPGRYVHYFTLEDGTKASAMSGCIKLFPMSQICREDMALTDKERELAKKGWKPNSWQTKMRAAIASFYAGEVSEADALRTIQWQKNAQAQYRAAKRGRRF